MSPLCRVLDPHRTQTLAEEMPDQLRDSEKHPVINLTAALLKKPGS